MDKIDTWIEERFGTPNTFNRQLLDNFIEFLEKELGYVIKDDDQGLPENPYPDNVLSQAYDKWMAYHQSQQAMKHWVKVKEKSNAEG